MLKLVENGDSFVVKSFDGQISYVLFVAVAGFIYGRSVVVRPSLEVQRASDILSIGYRPVNFNDNGSKISFPH